MAVEQTKGVHATMCALEVFWKMTGSTDTPMSQVLTFLHVAARGELPMADLADSTGVVLSSVSRNVAKIGPGPNPKEPGLGLVEAFEDPWNRKRKLVRLSAKGRKLAERINDEVLTKVLRGAK
jgi:DNA-binding MarR family transcriptional regulator